MKFLSSENEQFVVNWDFGYESFDYLKSIVQFYHETFQNFLLSKIILGRFCIYYFGSFFRSASF